MRPAQRLSTIACRSIAWVKARRTSGLASWAWFLSNTVRRWLRMVPPCTSNAAFFSMSGNLVRRDVAGELVFARQQAVDAARDLRHLDETDALDRRTAAPIFVMRLERRATRRA